MRILYLHQHFSTRAGVGGTRSYEFARLLQARGHEVTVLCGRGEQAGLPGMGQSWIMKMDLEGVNVIALNIPYRQGMGYGRRLMAFAAFVLLASWVVARHRDADIIYASSTPLTIVLPAVLASWLRGIPFVFEVRDLWPGVPIGLGILRNRVAIRLARWLERFGYDRAKHVVALSPGMRDAIMHSGVPAEKVRVIPNACDNDLFDVSPESGQDFRSRYPFLHDRRVVLYSGAFGLVNGLAYLVRLADRVRLIDKSIGFLLIGAGKEKTGLQSLAQNLGVLNENLWFLDPLPRSNMPQAMSAATVAVSTVSPYPVLCDNSANKVFDALAAGRPVVINHGGWLAELLERTKSGIVLPSDDVAKAAVMLVDFLHSEPRLKAATLAARRLATEEFDRERLVGQLEEVLLRARRC